MPYRMAVCNSEGIVRWLSGIVNKNFNAPKGQKTATIPAI
jgi:hypothetical protein